MLSLQLLPLWSQVSVCSLKVTMESHTVGIFLCDFFKVYLHCSQGEKLLGVNIWLTENGIFGNWDIFRHYKFPFFSLPERM